MKSKNLLAVVLVCLMAFGANSLVKASWPISEEKTQYDTVVMYEKAKGVTISEYNESPSLAAMVAEGVLPPVTERLPAEPAVVQPTDEIGKYGGTFMRPWVGPADHWGVRHLVREKFVYADDFGVIQPNVPKAIEVLDDGATYVFHMREGMRWSDGHPVTAEDVAFWFEDVKFHKELYYPFRDDMLIDGQPPEIEIIDNYTIKISYPRTHGTFLEIVEMDGRTDLLAPKHYLMQFHADYASEEELQKIMDEEGFDTWVSLFDAKYNWSDRNPERPLIYAWIPVNEPSEQHYILERNPYYWKVDPEGNQLPYIDRIVNEYVTDKELYTMKGLSGELTLHGRDTLVEDYTLFMENRERGDYQVAFPRNTSGGAAIHLNHTHRDPIKRELFNNKTFRQALSLAIDREEINELVYQGLGVPRQASIVRASPYYNIEWEQAYAEYDPERANQMLDEIGLERGSDGIRRMPDGQPLNLYIEVADGMYLTDIELVTAYWKDIGIALHINTPERSLFQQRTQANNFDIAVWHVELPIRSDLQYRMWAPSVLGREGFNWASAYNTWYATGGESGEEPPAELKRLNTLAELIKDTINVDDRFEIMNEVIDYHKENIHVIGLVGELGKPIIISNKLGNTTKARDFVWADEHPVHQLFFK